MSGRSAKLPRSIARCLWSYDASSVDLDRDRSLIITCVLNYGDWNALRWLHQTYPERVIKEVVSHPRRGVWLRQVLNFWCVMLRVRLPRRIREQAVVSLEPRVHGV